jgi:N-acyl homoserine lactone hydrolase
MSTKMRMYALHCGGDVSEMATFDPLDEDPHKIVFSPYFLYLIRHPEGNVLFDSGVNPALATEPEERLGETADTYGLRLSPEDQIERRLAAVGLKPADVDFVVQSHLHFDHAGGLQWLRHAPVLVQREELPFAFDPTPEQRPFYLRDDFDHDLDWRRLDGDHDVFGDGRVVVLATPGHTPGHQSLLLRFDSHTRILLSDAAYLIGKMRARRLPPFTWDEELALASMDRLEGLERELGAVLMTSHELDYRESVRLAPEQWYE